MLDLFAIGLSFALFVVCFCYVRGCSALKGGR